MVVVRNILNGVSGIISTGCTELTVVTTVVRVSANSVTQNMGSVCFCFIPFVEIIVDDFIIASIVVLIVVCIVVFFVVFIVVFIVVIVGIFTGLSEIKAVTVNVLGEVPFKIKKN